MEKTIAIFVSDLERLLQFTADEVGFYNEICKLSKYKERVPFVLYLALRREHLVSLYLLLRLLKGPAGIKCPDLDNCAWTALLAHLKAGDCYREKKIHNTVVEEACRRYKKILLSVSQQDYYISWLLQCHHNEIKNMVL